MSNASRNFQSVRSKISNAISGAVSAMIQQKISNEQKMAFLEGLLLYLYFVKFFFVVYSLLNLAHSLANYNLIPLNCNKKSCFLCIDALKNSGIIRCIGFTKNMRVKLAKEALDLLDMHENLEPTPYWFRPLKKEGGCVLSFLLGLFVAD